MGRHFLSPTLGEHNPNVRPILHGGTSAKTVEQAVTNLGAVKLADVGKPNFPIALNELGKVTAELDPNIGLSGLSLHGPTEVTVGKTVTYRITDFNYSINYQVTAVGGTATLSGDIITYVAGSSVGEFTLTLNNRTVPVKLVAAKPEAPVIIVPVANASNQALVISFTASVFKMDAGTDSHIATDWELTTNSANGLSTVPIPQVVGDTVNLTTWQVTGLQQQTTYFVRARYQGAVSGYGPWSEASAFTTGQ